MYYLTGEELIKLLRTAKQHSERHWLMLLVALDHGLRVSEVISLTRSNVQDGFLMINRLKGSLKTVQKLVEHQDPLLNEKSALETLVSGLKPKERLFPITRHGVTYLMRRYCEEAGIPRHKASPHKLKHSCAMLMVKAGIGVESIRQRLGHQSLSSTGRYMHIGDEEAAQDFGKAFAAVMGGYSVADSLL